MYSLPSEAEDVELYGNVAGQCLARYVVSGKVEERPSRASRISGTEKQVDCHIVSGVPVLFQPSSDRLSPCQTTLWHTRPAIADDSACVARQGPQP